MTKPIETRISGIILRHALERVDFSVRDSTTRAVMAMAIPKAYHPQVAKNRQAALEDAAAVAGGSIALATAQLITTETAKAAIATGYGDTFEDALFDLQRALKAL
jgi:hypothetical protein